VADWAAELARDYRRDAQRLQRRLERAERQLDAVERVLAAAKRVSPSPYMAVYVSDLERALGREAVYAHKKGAS
jgi:hypothetical protein